MKILITGCCGFVGTNLINDFIKEGWLKNGDNQIVGIDDLSHGTYIPEVHDHIEFYGTDILDEDSIDLIFKRERPDVVYHFAGLVSIYDCDKRPYDAYLINVMGSIRVFNMCCEYKVKHCIFSETSAVYEDCPMTTQGYFEFQTNPRTIYATTKACVALTAESYRKTKGLNFTALRYFNIAGPLQDYARTVPPLFAGVILRYMGDHAPIVFGDGERRRDFIHVDDVNKFHRMIMLNEKTFGETYNLGTGTTRSIFEIINEVKTLMNESSTAIIEMPEINGEAFEIKANIDKARSLGWHPSKTIEDALNDTYQYLKKEVENGIINPMEFMEDLDIEKVKI